MLIVGLAIALDPGPAPPASPPPPVSLGPATPTNFVVLAFPVPPPADFPVGRYGIVVTAADRPAKRLFLGEQEIDFRPDGTYVQYGTIDGGGLYRVVRDRIEFHRETLCRNDRQVGFYRWVREGTALRFSLDALGDACGNDRIWQLTAKPWQYRGPSPTR